MGSLSVGGKGRIFTYYNPADALRGVAAPLQVLGDRREHTGGKRHIEEAVGLGPPLLERLDVAGQAEEGLVLVILARDVGAEAAEVVELLLKFLSGNFYIGADPPEVLLVVHVRSRISDDLDVFGEELVAVLEGRWSV